MTGTRIVFDVKSVWRNLLPAAVFFSALRTSIGGATDSVLPAGNIPVTLIFRGVDPAHTPIDEQWLITEIATGLQAQSTRQFKSVGEPTAELTGLRNRLDRENSQIIFEYVHLARNEAG